MRRNKRSQRGRLVRVINGPHQDFTGRIIRECSDGRLEISLDVGRRMRMRVVVGKSEVESISGGQS